MNDEWRHLVRLIARLAAGLVLFAAGWWLLRGASEGLSTVLRFLGGVVAVLIGAVLVIPELTHVLSSPVGGLFFPNRRLGRPPPMYGIPESKRAKGLYEEAIRGFEQIAAKYPRELRPYVDMIDIAIVNLKDQSRAHAIYTQGMTALGRGEDRDTLTRMYAAILSRLAGIEDRKAGPRVLKPGAGGRPVSKNTSPREGP